MARQQSHKPSTSPAAFKGLVRVMIDREPWRLVVSMRGVRLTREELVAVLTPGEGSGVAEDDVGHLFGEGDAYRIQIEPEASHLPVPLVESRLRRMVMMASGVELTFGLAQGNQELECLLAASEVVSGKRG